MDLEKEIEKLLKDKPDGMSVHEISRKLIENGVLNNNDSNVCYFQVHARTYNMPEIFERKGDQVKLKK